MTPELLERLLLALFFRKYSLIEPYITEDMGFSEVVSLTLELITGQKWYTLEQVIEFTSEEVIEWVPNKP